MSAAAARAGGGAARVQVHLRRHTRGGWAPGTGVLGRWAGAALGRSARDCEISVLLVGRGRSRALNARYRGRDYATNVLSFPAAPMASAPTGADAGGPRTPGGAAREAGRRVALRAAGGRSAAPRLLGDLVICPAVLQREARVQHKSERAHWAHLVVHGVLHLVGFDHEDDADARRMERREIRVLAGLGFANPYRGPDA